MNINKEIKNVMVSIKDTNDENTKEVLKKRLGVMKFIKTAFMEFLTDTTNFEKILKFKNDDGTPLYPSHIDNVKDKDGKEVEVTVFDQDMNERIELLPEDIQQTIITEMARVREKNIDAYSKANRPELVEKEKFEYDVLSEFLPKEATEADVMEYLNEYYPTGIEKKFMGKVINEVKSAFERVNGGMVANCVKAKIVG
jgi:uncharacterized protein YqeY